MTATFSFTTWTATRLIALEKQTYSYQFGAKAEQAALDKRFEEYREVQRVQDQKIERKVDKTYDKVIKIAAKLNIPSD